MNSTQSNTMFGVPSIDDWFNDVTVSYTYLRGGRIQTAMSLLSDVQVLISHEQRESTRVAINRVKYVLDSTLELDRRTVAKLMRHLATRGFSVIGVSDEEERYATTNPATAMGHIFAVDEAWLHVESMNAGVSREQSIQLIPGNGEDVITDHTYSEPDADGFAAAMDSFEAPKELV